MLRAGEHEPGARSIDGEALVDVVLEPGAVQHTASRQLRATGSLEGVLPAGPGDVIHLDTAQLAEAPSVRVELVVPVAQTGAAPRPVRVYSAHRAPIELMTAPLTGDRTRLRIDMPSHTFDRPGRYVVEVESTEKSVFPVRRFAIEVR
jgi:hypothetical protein